MPTSDRERLLTTTEAAAYLHVHRNTLGRWTRNGDIPAAAMGTGGHYRYRLADLDSFIAESLTVPEKPDDRQVAAQLLRSMVMDGDDDFQAMDEARRIIPSVEPAVLQALAASVTPTQRKLNTLLLDAIRDWCNKYVDGYYSENYRRDEAEPFA